MAQSIKLGSDTYLDWTGVMTRGSHGYDTLDKFIAYKDKYFSNVQIPSGGNYASLGDFYTDIGVPNGMYILSYYIRGWSGATCPISLMSSSDGNTLYIGGAPQTISSITVRVYYLNL